MTVHLTVVGVGVEPSLDPYDIMGYVTFVPELAGKDLSNTRIMAYNVRTAVEGYRVIHLRILDDEVDLDRLTVVLHDPAKLGMQADTLPNDMTVVRFQQFMTEIYQRLSDMKPFSLDDFKMSPAHANEAIDDTIGFWIDGDVSVIENEVTTVDRANFRTL